MKNKLLVAAAILVLVAGVLFATARHNQKEAQVKAVAAQQAKDAKVESDKQVAVYKDTVEQLNAEKVQCEAGVAAWKLLTPALQKTQAKPDCELSFR